MSVTELLASWENINTALGLSGPVRDDAHYAELLAFVDEAFEGGSVGCRPCSQPGVGIHKKIVKPGAAGEPVNGLSLEQALADGRRLKQVRVKKVLVA